MIQVEACVEQVAATGVVGRLLVAFNLQVEANSVFAMSIHLGGHIHFSHAKHFDGWGRNAEALTASGSLDIQLQVSFRHGLATQVSQSHNDRGFLIETAGIGIRFKLMHGAINLACLA